MPRKTPRDLEWCRKLILHLRNRYFTPEAKAVAAREWQKIEARQAERERAMAAETPAGIPFGAFLSAAEREAPKETGAFTDAERARAARVLESIRSRGVYH